VSTRAQVLAQARQLEDDADRVLLLLDGLVRALGLCLDAEPAADAWEALRGAYDHAATLTDRPTRIVPERWPDGGLAEPWVQAELERAFESMRRLQAGALTPLVVQMHALDSRAGG
jgi:hypothetical protein